MARRCIAGPRLGSSTRARVREKLSRMSQKKNGEREAELPNRFDTRETAARRPHSHSAQAIRRGQRERRSEGEAHRAPGPAPTRPGAEGGVLRCTVWGVGHASRHQATWHLCDLHLSQAQRTALAGSPRRPAAAGAPGEWRGRLVPRPDARARRSHTAREARENATAGPIRYPVDRFPPSARTEPRLRSIWIS